MLLKALVLLTVCFQVLHTGNSEFPTLWTDTELMKNGWQKGKSVDVSINTFEHKGPNCKIEFQDENGGAGDRLLVSFSGSLRRFVTNSVVNGKWQRQDNHNDIEIPPKIDVNVKAEDNAFKITFKGKEYFRRYEFPLESIKIIEVFCEGTHTAAVADMTWGKE